MDAWNTAGFGPADASARAAVRIAEQVVSDSWIGLLMLAERETLDIVHACALVAEQAAERVRAAQQSGDLSALVRAQADLETVDLACGQALRAHEQAHDRLTSELDLWSQTTARRVRQSLSDPA